MYMNAFQTFMIIFGEYIGYLFHKNQEKTIINIAEKLAKINIIYVKFLQAISASSGIIDVKTKERLSQYSDNVPYTKDDLDFSFLKELQESGIYLKSTKPINSGLIAVVFKGSDINGNEYAIKVKRRNIFQKMSDSVQELEWIISKLMRYDFFKDINVKLHFERNKHILFEQLDFENEVEHIEIFYTNFENVDHIIIPKVYKEYTDKNNNLIVMDYIKGKTLKELDSKDKIHFSKIIAKFGVKCFFYDGIYHGDMHQGNIFFITETNKSLLKNDEANGENEENRENRENGENRENEENRENRENGENTVYKLGIIDFGIVGILNRIDQNTFYEFLQKLYSDDYENTAEYVYDNIIIPAKNKENLSEEIKKELIKNLAKILENSLEQKFTTAKDIYNMNYILSKHDLELSAFFSDAQLALIVNNTLCNNLTHEEGMIFFDIYKDEFSNL